MRNFKCAHTRSYPYIEIYIFLYNVENSRALIFKSSRGLKTLVIHYVIYQSMILMYFSSYNTMDAGRHDSSWSCYYTFPWIFQSVLYIYKYIYMYIYIHTCLLLLISMLWHRQAIFESKGDKLSSSTECRIRTHQGLRHQIASRLNARWQTDWAIEDQAKNLNSTARPYDHSAHLTPQPFGIRTFWVCIIQVESVIFTLHQWLNAKEMQRKCVSNGVASLLH